MAKTVKKDTGMMEQKMSVFSMDDPKDVATLSNILSALSNTQLEKLHGDWIGDASRRDKAEQCRRMLLDAEIPDDGRSIFNPGPLKEKGLAENSAQWIAAQWLAHYNGLLACRGSFDAGEVNPQIIGLMLRNAEEMGRLEERMWWRAGADPQTKKKREELALSGRRQVKGGHDGNAMKGQLSFKVKHGQEAQERAQEIHKKKPALSWTAIRGTIAREYGVSPETIKNALTNPKKHG